MDNNTFFYGEEITSDKIGELDKQTIEFCCNEGNKAIDNLVQIGRNIRSTCINLLNILITILMSLIGVLFIQICSSKETNYIIIYACLYGIMASGIVSYRLIKGAIYQSPLYISGDRPSHIIRNDVMECLVTIKDKRDKHKYIIGWQLMDLEYRYSKNENENIRKLEVYKSAIKLIFVFLSFAVLGFAVLEIFLQ